MDKTAIRNFAIEARKILMKSAITEAGFYGITKDGCKSPIQKGNDFEVYETLAGTENRIYGDDIKRRANLVRAIEEQGFDQVIEETAYTWFNRIIAIRFMEVNNYLPTRVRVLSSETGSGTPDIITQADTVELNLTSDELDKIQTAKRENKYDEAFRLLFVKQCNELNDILPGLFEKTNDYMELLLKITYTGDGVVRMLVDTIPEDNFNVETEGQVEIIGWMYQYYNTELKDDTFAKLKKNVKITKERIPAATQLFTPDWIVRYMVENSLGRVWIEHLRTLDPSLDEKAKAEEFGWKYYLPEAEQEENVAAQLVEIRQSYKDLTPQDITCIDPCMGSGHILVYMFDVLMDIYRSEGFSEREAVFDVLEKNIRGLDIDRRAYQLSYFALMMKARGYNRIFFRGRENIDGERVQAVPQVYAIVESNNINRNQLKYFGENLSDIEKNDALNQLNGLLDQLIDAKEFGSILQLSTYNWNLLKQFVNEYSIPGQMDLEMIGIEDTKKKLIELVCQSSVLGHKYKVTITNPPYMGVSTGSEKLIKYVKKYYLSGKEDLFTVFILRCMEMTEKFGFQAMITQHTWMFLSRAEKLRKEMLSYCVENLVHLGPRAFDEIGGEVVQTASFVFRKAVIGGMNGVYSRVVEGKNEAEKESAFLNKQKETIYSQSDFEKIPGSIMAYWISRNQVNNFREKNFNDLAEARVGLDTGNNDLFLRYWYEVDFSKIAFDIQNVEELHSQIAKKYVPHTKGGSYRKWYGNYDYIIAFNKKNYDSLLESGNHLPSRQFYFKEGMSWTRVSSKFAVRYSPKGMVFNSACPTVFTEEKWKWYTLGLLNSCVVDSYSQLLSPTINFQAGDIGKIPFMKAEEYLDEINLLVKENIALVKNDWDSRENSWDFKMDPIVGCTNGNETICEAVERYIESINNSISKLVANEERLNELFIKIYHLEEDLDSKIPSELISISVPSKSELVKRLIQYAVGCMFGRYSLDKKGLIFAGGKFDKSQYIRFMPDDDGIIPITDEKYFDDDIVERFCSFIKEVFGETYYENNLEFIASELGYKNMAASESIREYFTNKFWGDHCNQYNVAGGGKRPIYWLFDSGKENGFKCLVYIHRYSEDTIGTIRSDYLVKEQVAIENALKNVEYILQTSSSAVDKALATKKRDKYLKQIAEMRLYYQAISHVALQRIALNLDDGIKDNYSKFQNIEVSNEGEKKQTIDLLAKI